MSYVFVTPTLKTRRGVSNIIGSLVVLALVASIGSVILIQGLNQINSFSHDLAVHDRVHNQALREDLIFEHIRFDPNTNQMDLYLANIGSIESTIDHITMVKIDSQELVMAWKDVPAVDATIQIEDHKLIPLSADLTQGTQIWNSTDYQFSDYKITVSTSKGNFFSTIAKPGDNFNT